MNAADDARRTAWIDDNLREIAEPHSPARHPVHLTPRQLEVLDLLCEGLPNKLICRRLNIASGTVKPTSAASCASWAWAAACRR